MSNPPHLKPKQNPTPPAMPKPGDVYEIPAEGSLGLLALGYRGLVAWRQKRAEVFEQMKQAEAPKQESEAEEKDE